MRSFILKAVTIAAPEYLYTLHLPVNDKVYTVVNFIIKSINKELQDDYI